MYQNQEIYLIKQISEIILSGVLHYEFSCHE